MKNSFIFLLFLVFVTGCTQTGNVVENREKEVELTIEDAITDSDGTTTTSTSTTLPTASSLTTTTETTTTTDTIVTTTTSTTVPEETTTTTIEGVDHLIITEVLYDPIGKESEEEFVEIYNPTDETVNLSGWIIEDNAGSWSFPGVEIISLSYYRISRDNTGFSTLHGCDPDIDTFTRGLNNGGDQLMLKNGEDIIDFVAWGEGYDDAYPEWNLDVEEGKTISRNIVDTDSASDWAESEASVC
jgi:hypothetical protein